MHPLRFRFFAFAFLVVVIPATNAQEVVDSQAFIAVDGTNSLAAEIADFPPQLNQSHSQTQPFVGFASDSSAGRFTRWLVNDPIGLLSDVDIKTAAVGAGVAGGVVIASLIDASLSETASRRYTGAAVPVLDTVNQLGSPLALGGAGLLFGGTLLTNDDHLQSAAFTSFEAGLYATALTFALKTAVGRVRPSDGTDPYDFQPFSGNASFPSGHTTLAFALVTPWVMYYNHPWTYGLYVVAAGTAVARVVLARHWPSDVLAGAAIGTAMGYGLSRRHLSDSATLSISPSLSGSTPSLHFSLTF